MKKFFKSLWVHCLIIGGSICGFIWSQIIAILGIIGLAIGACVFFLIYRNIKKTDGHLNIED